MSNGKDPFGFKRMTRIEILGASQTLAKVNFLSNIQNARERLDEIAAHLDDHLGFAPEEVNFDAAEIAQTILNKLDEALAAAEKTADLNQALDQSDRDNPGR